MCMIRSILLLSAAVVGICASQASSGEGEIDCRGHFSGKILTQSGRLFSGSLQVTCRNLGTTAMYLYNSCRGGWVRDWEAETWFEQVVTADPEYDITLEVVRDPFPKDPLNGDLHQ